MTVLRVVSIASRSGAYGGPYDTARRQVALAQATGRQARLWAGIMANDAPETDAVPSGTVLINVRNILPRFGFVFVCSGQAIRSLIQEIGASDAVHVSFGRELLPVLAAMIAKIKRKQLFIQPHGMLTNRSSALHRILDLGIKPIVKSSDAIIALTEIERAALSAWIGRAVVKRWLVMGNPVGRLSSGPGIVRTRPLQREALWVARLHERKRVEDFLAAAALSNSKQRNIGFTVIGPEGGQLPLVMAAVAAQPDVVYEGSISSTAVTERVNRTGVFVLTSLREPWGNVLATALSLGVPVVVTASSALAGPIQRFSAGLVVPDASPAEVEEAVGLLLDNAELYEAASRGALELASALLSDDFVSETLNDLYKIPQDDHS